MDIIASVTLCVGNPNDLDTIPPGKSVNIPDEEAQTLIERQLARPVEAIAPSVEDRLDALVDAIGDLEPDQFSQEGKPTVKALEALVGHTITASERDDAWSLFQSLMQDSE